MTPKWQVTTDKRKLLKLLHEISTGRDSPNGYMITFVHTLPVNHQKHHNMHDLGYIIPYKCPMLRGPQSR